MSGSGFPTLPLIFWTEDVFKEIRNILGFYYEADFSFHTTSNMGMARLLVGLNVSKGLADTISIKCG
jgi:hypothetical protein